MVLVLMVIQWIMGSGVWIRNRKRRSWSWRWSVLLLLVIESGGRSVIQRRRCGCGSWWRALVPQRMKVDYLISQPFFTITRIHCWLFEFSFSSVPGGAGGGGGGEFYCSINCLRY